MVFHLDGIGLCAEGLPNWSVGRAVLAGAAPYRADEIVMAASSLLPPAERRRTTETVKLAMTVGEEAVAHAGLRAEETMSVFTSSGGDGRTITAILEALASPERDVSPTRFHNSVHNAPAGYWTIATGCREASTSLCAHDSSFAAGLLEVAARVQVDQRPALLVAYDVPYPPALAACRKIAAPFGTALMISPRRSAMTLAELTIGRPHEPIADTRLEIRAFEALRVGVPAARALPLLAAIAQGKASKIDISGIAIGVTPVAHDR